MHPKEAEEKVCEYYNTVHNGHLSVRGWDCDSLYH